MGLWEPPGEGPAPVAATVEGYAQHALRSSKGHHIHTTHNGIHEIRMGYRSLRDRRIQFALMTFPT